MENGIDPTYYEILGVPPGTEEGLIKARFRALAQENHPDHGGTHANYLRLQEAASVLTDRTRRKAYDKELRFVRSPCPRCGGQGRVFTMARFTQGQPSRCQGCDGVGFLPRVAKEKL